MIKLSFSGHETFICKQFWLKKGYDYLKAGKSFNDDEAVVDLGVGKNMVSSIAFWLKSFGLLNEDSRKPNELANKLFSEGGLDSYLEDIGTMWLLHYQLIKTGRASIFSLFFNEFRRERLEFKREHLFQFLKRKCEENKLPVSETSLQNDIKVFLNTYTRPKMTEKLEVEDSFMGLLLDLNLIKISEIKNNHDRREDWYHLTNENRDDLPVLILLYTILDWVEEKSSITTITLKELMVSFNSAGSIFALNREGMYEKMIQLTQLPYNIVFKEDAGIQTLQFKEKLNKFDILNAYYKS
jgi:hypothetical protein